MGGRGSCMYTTTPILWNIFLVDYSLSAFRWNVPSQATRTWFCKDNLLRDLELCTLKKIKSELWVNARTNRDFTCMYKIECFTSLNLSLNFKYTIASLIMCRILTVSTSCKRPISTGRLSPLGPSLILGLISVLEKSPKLFSTIHLISR